MNARPWKPFTSTLESGVQAGMEPGFTPNPEVSLISPVLDLHGLQVYFLAVTVWDWDRDWTTLLGGKTLHSHWEQSGKATNVSALLVNVHAYVTLQCCIITVLP